MLKFIIILVLVIYILNRVIIFFFRVGRRPQQTPPHFRPPADGSIRMDNAPKKGNKKSGLKGGEYIDYEEVK